MPESSGIYVSRETWAVGRQLNGGRPLWFCTVAMPTDRACRDAPAIEFGDHRPHLRRPQQ
ncbi:protein of unknown function [Pararobbsia alpina]